MKLTSRDIHRDLAYLYVGLIISFAFSGIFMNHRDTWDPKKYTYEKRDFTTSPISEALVDKAYVTKLVEENGISDRLRRYNVKDSTLRISFEKHDLTLDINTGKGEIEIYRITPVLGQMATLHKESSNWWIYYSDVFGISLIVIAITGTMIQKGSKSFRKRGWKLAMAGLVFPLIVLFLLT
jgi:uncharacterized protein